MTAPTLNGQILGQAERATRALLERVLRRENLTFEQSVAMNLTAARGGQLPLDLLVDTIASGLKIARADATAAVEAGIHNGLFAAEGVTVRLTDAGRAQHAAVTAEIADITARLYGGLPADELALAARVLITVTERANAELAA